MNERISSIKGFISRNGMYFILLALIIILALINPEFLSWRCIRDILLQCSTRAIIALGMAFVLITGGVDLSAGRMVGLAAVISASMLQTADYARRFYPDLPQLPLWLPILISIGVCFLFGVLNGVLISKLSLPPFIATLGSTVIIYGANSLYFNLPPNNSQPIGGLRSDFTNLGTGFIGITNVYSIPYILIIAIVVAIIIWIILNKTSVGKNVYAVGGNINAARVSGINVAKTLIFVYAIAAVLFGLGGVLEAARTGGATNNYGNMYELDAIAACVVGGVSPTGGIGTIEGVLAGVLIFGVINYGLTFIGVDPYWQLITRGIIIVVAVALDVRKYLARK